MCLAIPGKLTAITGQLDETFRFGKVSFGGIMKEVNLSMVPEAKVGDYVSSACRCSHKSCRRRGSS
jgi:hydrogenase expression/formation protein HypC